MRGAMIGVRLGLGLVLGLGAGVGLSACDGDHRAAIPTAASVAVVRGRVDVGEERLRDGGRIAMDGTVTTADDGRARARFDEGATALLDVGTRMKVTSGSAAEITTGRAFFDVPEGEPFVLTTPEGELRFVDAQLSVEPSRTGVRVDVIRGSVAHRRGQRRGVVGSGRSLTLTAARADVAPQAVWDDWTGGLAAPGPRDPREAAGVGVLEGRRPGDVGEARWPLIVRTLDVKVRIVGDLAITDVEQIFFNPASSTLEGLYRIRVPEGSVLHRFAVDRQGTMVDGYVREKRDAAAAYQAQVYAGSTLDPALLEWDSQGSYRARIHPINAGESRRIAIRYSQWLPRGKGPEPRTYRFPMGGGNDAPEVEALSIDVDLGATTFDSVRASHGATLVESSVRLRRSDTRPRADFVLELVGEQEGMTAYRAEHHDPLRDPNAIRPTGDESDYIFLPLDVDPPSSSRENAPVDLVVIADLSAGTDRSRLELGRTVIEAIAAQLREGDRIAVLGGDLTLRSLGEGSALGPATRTRMRTLLDALARAPAGGASDLGAMLTEAAALLDPARNGSVVYVGDGAPTVGELGAGPLLDRLARLPNPLRTFAVAVGDDANAELLASIARGSGSMTRVTTRAEAADAALDIVGRAIRPVISRVTVDLGTGVDRVYPRDASSTTLGTPIPIVARVRGSVPSSVKISGFVNGRAFERRVPIHVESIDDSGDLRLRWATARLERLLLDGARRTEVVDLGVRAGVITPFTSLYVPSAAELASLGPNGRVLVETAMLEREPHLRTSGGAITSVIGWAVAPLASLWGCASKDAEPAAASGSVQQEAPSEIAATEDRAMAREAAAGAPSPQPAAPAAAMAPREEGEMARNAAPSPGGGEGNLMGAQIGDPQGGLGLIGTGTGGGGSGSGYGAGQGRDDDGAAAEAPSRPVARAPTNAPSQPRRAASTRHAAQTAPTTTATTTAGPLGSLARLLTTDAERRRARESDDLRAAADATVTLDAHVTVSVSAVDHTRRHCSEASGLMLDARASLWQERLANAGDPNGWAHVYEHAVANCEAPTARDRRKLLDLVLSRAGDVQTMVHTYQSFVAQGARMYLRRAIFLRVRTPDELRIVRGAFGSTTVNAALIDGELARVTDDAGRVRVLRRLVTRFDGDLELSMRLLTIYERLGRRDDAKQLALVLRGNPMGDAGMRTAIGEMFLRMGDEPEARRTFSEIVEFAPNDELARRRLGDLYRAHGWYDDAYRQYQTLAALRPDDTTVLLLLAQAAAGAGRIDEALRLEQRLAETAPPGGAEGPARTALLWSSVRLAELRAAARQRGDTAQLRAYLGAMRRGGVLREAGDLRATLVWAHPDADLALYAAYPGLSLSRPNDISPELGLEAFDVREREAGTYRVEVRRGARDSLTTVDAKLVVVFREGRPDERIVILPVRFRAGAMRQTFVIDGDSVQAGPVTASLTSGGAQ